MPHVRFRPKGPEGTYRCPTRCSKMRSLNDEDLWHALRGAATIIFMAGVVAIGPATAQTLPSTTPTGPASCAPSSPAPGSSAAPPPRSDAAKSSGQPTENLSERLSRSEGVMCPPSKVDLGMVAPTPDAGIMLVIPPPGSPGGDPNIRPK